jgi:hypothetical protein
MSYIGREPQVGNFQVCDAISVVNGQAAYTMQVNSVNVSPETANHMLVSLNGVLQAPGSSYTVSGSTITFASNLVTGDVINFIHILGSVLDLGVPSDDTVTAAKLGANSVTAAKLNNDIISGSTELASEPADTDEFLVSDAGTLKRIDYSHIKGGGKILQVLTASDSTERTTTSTSFVTASSTLTVDITPSATSSKIFVVASIGGYKKDGGAMHLSIYRGSTNLGHNDRGMINGDANNVRYSSAMTVLDSPNTTSATTYRVRIRSEGGDTVRLNADGVESNIVVMEVGA